MTTSLATSPIDRFANQRRARWERLATLLERATSGQARHRMPLTVDELDELLRLYRLVTTDLALARREFGNDRVTRLLNELVARAYGFIYRETPAPFSRLRRFFSHDLPREYRSAWPFLATASAIFFVPWIVAMIAIIVSPDTAAFMVPPGLLSEIKNGQTWFAAPNEERPVLASFVMTNNMEVSFLAVGGGIFAGLGTIYVLASNGLSLGGISGALVAYHLTTQLLGFIGPHGFLELSVVVISGGCGLMLGHAVIWPGLQPRSQAVSAAAGRAVHLLLGVLPFLVVAGLLEGLVSPADFAWPLKVAIGLVTAVCLYGYLLLVGRGDPKPLL